MNKVALFDFCETLANFQTADAYVGYVRQSMQSPRMDRLEAMRKFLSKVKIISIIRRLFPKVSLNKKLVLYQLRGVSRDVLEQYAEEYYSNIVRPNLIKATVQELIKLRDDGWRIVIVSGGYLIYLKHFADEYKIHYEDVIADDFLYKDDICMGMLKDGDRLWDKVDTLNKRFNRDVIDSIAFSDSITDLPMLKWAKNGIVVRNANKESWAYKHDLKELVWL